MAVIGLNWNEVLELFEPIKIMKWIPAILIFLRMSSNDFGEIFKIDFELYELQ